MATQKTSTTPAAAPPAAAATAAPAAVETPAAAPQLVEGVDLSGIEFFEPDAPGAAGDQPPAEEAAAETPAEGEEGAEGEQQEETPTEEPAKKPEPQSEVFLRMAKMEAVNRELKAKLEELEKGREELTEENFWDLAAKKGIDRQKLIDQLVDPESKKKPKTEAELKAEKLEQEVALLKKREEEREAALQAERRRALVEEQKGGLRKSINEAEDLPFVKAFGEDAVDNIWETARQYYQQHNTAPDLAAITRTWEAYYAEKYAKAQPALTPGATNGTMPASRSPQQTASARPPAPGPKPKLTNRAAASATPPAPNRPQTEEERIKAATEAITFEP